MSENFEDTKWYSYSSSTETMRTWARRIESFDEVPQEFQAAFPKNGAYFPYTLFIPENRLAPFREMNRKILCLYEDHFVLLERLRKQIKTASSPMGELLCLEHGRVLLDSWLKIVTLSGTHTLRFNTTNQPLFVPVIEKIRRAMSGAGPIDLAEPDNHAANPALSQFNYLNQVSFKYMNYGKASIHSDDALIAIVYQPERCVQEIRFLARTLFRRWTTEHLAILTDKELILIKEAKHIKSKKESRYGGVFTYIPRCQIGNIAFIPNPAKSLCAMEINLPEKNRIVSEFSLANAEITKLQDALGVVPGS